VKKGPKIDLTGIKTERLEVLGPAGQTRRGHRLWTCKCLCGVVVEITTGNLAGKRPTKSCGCALKDRPQNLRLTADPDSLARQLMGHYKQGAERRKIPFDLTFEQFKSLVESPCYYCGQEPNRVYRPTRYKSVFLSNGVDRFINSEGYVYFNCAPCCKVCNRAKSDMSVGEFLDFIQRAHAYSIVPRLKAI
jgi:hypothetical protein